MSVNNGKSFIFAMIVRVLGVRDLDTLLSMMEPCTLNLSEYYSSKCLRNSKSRRKTQFKPLLLLIAQESSSFKCFLK